MAPDAESPPTPSEPPRDDLKVRRANLRDVAKRAGVGLGTASRALSGEFAIRLDTALAVREAAAELGYTLPQPSGVHFPRAVG